MLDQQRRLAARRSNELSSNEYGVDGGHDGAGIDVMALNDGGEDDELGLEAELAKIAPIPSLHGFSLTRMCTRGRARQGEEERRQEARGKGRGEGREKAKVRASGRGGPRGMRLA